MPGPTRLALHTIAPFAVATLLFVSGCRSVPEGGPELPASLQLLESAQLYIPNGCVAEASVRVDFVVLENGRTEHIRTPEVAPCLHEALVAWVESFRYSPPAARRDESVEWLLVTGRRGS